MGFAVSLATSAPISANAVPRRSALATARHSARRPRLVRQQRGNQIGLGPGLVGREEVLQLPDQPMPHDQQRLAFASRERIPHLTQRVTVEWVRILPFSP